jgi:hypothetical protein
MIRKINGSFPRTAFLLMVVLSIFLVPRLFKVKTQCASQSGACPNDIALEIREYDNRSLQSAKKGVRDLLKYKFAVSDFSLQYKLPNILKVNLIIKQPAFSLKDTVENKQYLVDEEGVVLAVSSAELLPEVQVGLERSFDVGDVVPDEYLFALNIQRGLDKMFGSKSGRIEDNSLVVELRDQIKVTFPLQGEVDVVLGSLRLIISKIEDGSQTRRFSEIDLRFRDPVLR